MDEALALPTEKAARIALRTQQVIAHETGVANVADPLGGSWYVEALTDEMERRPRRCSPTSTSSGTARCSRACTRPSTTAGSRARSPTRSYQFERKINSGERVVVGVNRFTEGNDDAELDILQITHEQEQQQIKRLQAVRADRDSDAVARELDQRPGRRRDPERNLMPALIDAVRAYATEGEIMQRARRRVRPLRREARSLTERPRAPCQRGDVRLWTGAGRASALA